MNHEPVSSPPNVHLSLTGACLGCEAMLRRAVRVSRSATSWVGACDVPSSARGIMKARKEASCTPT